jgi:hypothetical protein
VPVRSRIIPVRPIRPRPPLSSLPGGGAVRTMGEGDGIESLRTGGATGGETGAAATGAAVWRGLVVVVGRGTTGDRAGALVVVVAFLPMGRVYPRVAGACVMANITIGAAETGAFETGTLATGAFATGFATGFPTGALETGALETGALETGASDTGASDTGALETGALETGALETGAFDVGGAFGVTGALDVGGRATGVATGALVSFFVLSSSFSLVS